MERFNGKYNQAQYDVATRKSLKRRIACAAKLGDNPDTVAIAAADVYQLMPVDLAGLAGEGFQFVDNGVRYFEEEPIGCIFNGTATVGVSTPVVIVHFKLAINGVPLDETESAVKLANSTDLATINASSFINVEQYDTIQVYVKADKTCTVSSYHMQLQIMEV